jgi:hypothetical protein
VGKPRYSSTAFWRSPVFLVIAGVVVIALITGGIVLATRSARAPVPTTPAASTRVVALGDSVPYGHGLANPYLTPQQGLPPGAVSQGPSTQAYPSLIAHDLRLDMTVRAMNCDLVGDQLAISGAVADPADNRALDGQCPRPPRPARNLDNEVVAAGLDRHPARLVLLQDGADDIHFAQCLVYDLVHVRGVGLSLGTDCVSNGTVTTPVARELANVRQSLARAIEAVAPHTRTVAVMDYYQPIPQPSQIADDTGASGLGTNLVCAGLRLGSTGTYADAQVVLRALNRTISGAVADARAHGVHDVVLVDISHVVDGHAMCAAHPWVFSGERVSDLTLATDSEHILAAKACQATTALHGEMSCAPLTAAAVGAERNIKGYVWRASHPTAQGQQAIATAVLQQLRASGQSIARRSSETNFDAPSGPAPASSRRTRAEPTTTPSASWHNSAACVGVDTPTPTQTGMSVCSRIRSTTPATSTPTSERSPVTPIRATA